MNQCLLSITSIELVVVGLASRQYLMSMCAQVALCAINMHNMLPKLFPSVCIYWYMLIYCMYLQANIARNAGKLHTCTHARPPTFTHVHIHVCFCRWACVVHSV